MSTSDRERVSRSNLVVPIAAVATCAVGFYQLFLKMSKGTRAPVHKEVPSRKKQRQPQLRERAVLFGDSITQYSFANVGMRSNGGWGSLLAGTYARTLDVVNRGFSGYTTRWALDIADIVLGIDNDATNEGDNTKKFLFVTIFFGANDSADPVLNPSQSVPVEEYGRNLASLIQKAKSVASHVVVISPPPIDDEHWARHREQEASDRVNSRTVTYVEAGRTEASKGGALFVDVFHSMLEQENWKTFLNDGLHLSATGNEFLFQELHKVLKGEAGIDEEQLPIDFPLWADMQQFTGKPLNKDNLEQLPYPVRAHVGARM